MRLGLSGLSEGGGRGALVEIEKGWRKGESGGVASDASHVDAVEGEGQLLLSSSERGEGGSSFHEKVCPVIEAHFRTSEFPSRVKRGGGD